MAQVAPHPQPRRRSHLRLVDGKRQKKVRRARKLMRLGLLASCAVILSVVAFHVWLAQGQFRLDALDSQAKELEREYENARVDVARLSSPERVTKQAEEMGMIQPEVVTQIVVESAEARYPQDPVSVEGSWEKVKPSLATHP